MMYSCMQIVRGILPFLFTVSATIFTAVSVIFLVQKLVSGTIQKLDNRVTFGNRDSSAGNVYLRHGQKGCVFFFVCVRPPALPYQTNLLFLVATRSLSFSNGSRKYETKYVIILTIPVLFFFKFRSWSCILRRRQSMCLHLVHQPYAIFYIVKQCVRRSSFMKDCIRILMLVQSSDEPFPSMKMTLKTLNKQLHVSFETISCFSLLSLARARGFRNIPCVPGTMNFGMV